MAHIYIFSPSSAVREKPAFRRGVARLKALGHEVEIDEAALRTQQRFAGDDATRVEAISRAASSGADLAMISRGGYGLSRILDRIPYRQIAKAVERGTRFVGVSDFTGFQNAVLAKTGAVTWAGPALCPDFGCEEEPDEVMSACFDDLANATAEGTGWRMSPAQAQLFNTMRPVQQAVLWGGNLAMLCSLLGTPWMPDIRGGMLFLEDVSEHPYRLERMLIQLEQAGVLGRQKAILLGQFTGYRSVPHDRGFGLPTVIERLRERLRIPVICGLPYGHVPTKVCLPVGARASLLVEGREALVLWGHDH